MYDYDGFPFIILSKNTVKAPNSGTQSIGQTSNSGKKQNLFYYLIMDDK